MSLIADEDLQKLEAKVAQSGYVDREHLLEFLTLIPTNDAPVIIKEVQDWLTKLHDSTDLPTVHFNKGDIDAVIGDLDSYGRVQASTILEFKRNSNRVLPAS